MSIQVIGQVKQGIIGQDERGTLYLGRDDGLGSIGAFNWERLERIISPIVAGAGTWIASKSQPGLPKYDANAAALQAQLELERARANSGLGLDTNMLLLLAAGGALLFFAMKK